MFAKVKNFLSKVAPFAAVGMSGTLLESSDLTTITSQISGYAPDLVKSVLLILGVLILITVFGIIIKKIMSIRGAVAGLGGRRSRRRR